MYDYHERNRLLNFGLKLGLATLIIKLIWSLLPYMLTMAFGFVLCLVGVVHLSYKGSKLEAGNPVTIRKLSLELIAKDDSMDHLKTPLVNNSLVSEGLERILTLAIENYVISWYRGLIIPTQFPTQLKYVLSGAILNLGKRMEKIQLDEFLVLTALPMLTSHFKSFCLLEASSDGEKGLKYAHFQNGNLHPAIGPDGISEELLKDHLKLSVEKKMSSIFADDELNEINRILLVEIITSCLLYPVLSMLCDPDFFNRMIAESVGSIIKDRDQVTRFRNVLDQHSIQGSNLGGQLKKSRKLLNAKKSVSDLAGFRISPGMSQGNFEGSLRRVQLSHSTVQLKHLRYFLSIQLGKAIPEYEKLRFAGEESSESASLYKVYIKRLQLLRISADARLKKLMQKSGSNPENFSSHFDPTLLEVLENPFQLSFFQEFMEERGRERLLQFWVAVTAIRDPLEGLGVLLDDAPLMVNYELSQAQEVRDILDTFTDVIPDDQETAISQFLDNKGYEDYVQAKACLSQLQKEVFERMERSDFLAFKKSDCFLKLVAAEKFSQNEIAQDDSIKDVEDYAGDPLAHYEEFDDEEDQTMLSVQDALDEIMEDGRLSRRQLFPDFSTFQDESEEESNPTIDETFDNESESLSNSLSGSFDENNLIQLAAPNQLNLGEEIKRLTTSLSRLKEQMDFLSPLLNKAELTNNTGELRILRKSYLALEREVELQNRQVQQYVIQENENSLFGKTKVRIQSYIKGSEKGKRRYILYILEVQRVTGVEEQAGWIVARRFSQFYSLHEYLKPRFPEVQSLEFPKKVILNFQQKILVEERKTQLEEYLRSLLEIPQVCVDRMFRSFLSSEDFHFHHSGDSERLANRLYYGIYNRIKPAPVLQPATPDMMEMEKELDVLDNAENRVPFVKPVCDFIIALFALDKSGNWLKARAVLVVIQQLLGTAIEKKIRHVVASMTSETKVLDYLTMLQTTLWPENDARREKKPRELSEKIASKHEAEILLEMLFLDVSSKIFGVSGSKNAATKVFLMFQDEVLNANIVYQIFDRLMEQLFP